MPSPRLATLLIALPLLAACDSNSPPAAPAAEAAAARVADAPAAAADSRGPVADAAMAPIIGTFAADLSWCGGDAAGDGFPVTIKPTQFKGRENVCSINEISDAGNGSYEAHLTCTAEGQTVDERLVLVPIFAPSGEGLRITYADRGGDSTTLLRCG
jgi:hypothetical protein